MNILDKIVANKKKEVAAAKKQVPLGVLKKLLLGVKLPELKFSKRKSLQLIAELKPKSPSAGIIRTNFKPASLAKNFTKNSASAVSVLTDSKYFGGNLEIFSQARNSTKLPILRKDFIVDPYQIYESKLIGANIILLIASVLKSKIIRYVKIAESLNLQVLIEVHNRKELQNVLKSVKESEKIIIGINNRDLKTFKVNLNTSLKLIKMIPKEFVKISESGVSEPSQLKLLEKAGFDGVLIGTGLAKNPKLFNYFI